MTHELPEPLVWHESMAVFDSTKLAAAQQCLRRYFFEHVLGWRPVRPNIHLHFGSAAHSAFERLLWLAHRDGGPKPEHKEECMAAFLAEWRKHAAPVDDDTFEPKSPACFEWALERYIEAYCSDRFEVLWTEIAGSVPLTPDNDYWLHFKLDAVVRDGDKLKIIDHKTTGKAFPHDWTCSWRLSLQVGAYLHVGRCLFGGEFHGVVVNGVSLARRPRVRADGQPWANQRDNQPRFARANVEHSPEAAERWWFDTLHTYTEVLAEHERLAECSPSHLVMRAFPCNYSACWSCPYKRYCSVWANPLQHCAEPPVEMTVEHWDPRKREEAASATVVVESGKPAQILKKAEARA